MYISFVIFTITNLFLLLIPTGDSSPSSSREQDPRVVGGRPAHVSEIPFQVLITFTDYSFHEDSVVTRSRCGGSIYNTKWIITAAHCMFDKNKNKTEYSKLKFAVGKRNRLHPDLGEQYHEIIRVIIHPEYDPRDYDLNNDIALVRVKNDIVYTKTIKPIAIPSMNYVPSGKATVSGWGFTKKRYADTTFDDPYEAYKEIPEYLQVVTIDIIPHDKCVEWYANFNRSLAFEDGEGFVRLSKPGKNHVCAYGKDKDACNGDSGGPLTCTEAGKLVLCGIVSSGIGCALELPGFYTHVANFYCWILQNAGDSEGKEVKNLGSICKTKLRARSGNRYIAVSDFSLRETQKREKPSKTARNCKKLGETRNRAWGGT